MTNHNSQLLIMLLGGFGGVEKDLQCVRTQEGQVGEIDHQDVPVAKLRKCSGDRTVEPGDSCSVDFSGHYDYQRV